MTDLPHVIAGQLGVSEEHQRVAEAWWREHNDGPLPAGMRTTAAMYNAAVDWWNSLGTATVAPMTADEIWNSGTGSNDELVAILTSHGIVGDPDERRADVLIKTLIQWRNVSSRDVADKYQALKADRDRRTHFGLFSHEGVDIVCTDCNRGPTSEEDRELFNLAEYDAWADQHKCEAKP